MKKIYAPWRFSYVEKVPDHKAKKSVSECVFCTQFTAHDDRKYLILQRYKHSVAVMNFYPYNGGHLMVLPLAHKPDLVNLSDEERNEIFAVTNTCVEILKETLKPQGFNVGINLGDAGGGGIPSHMHVHILPRWSGDTNFLPLLADTKVINSDYWEVYDRLKPLFDKRG